MDGMMLYSTPMIVLDRVRSTNLPSVGDAAGNRRPLNLGGGTGLLEPTFFALLDHNAVAVLTSGNGPRPKRLVVLPRQVGDNGRAVDGCESL